MKSFYKTLFSFALILAAQNLVLVPSLYAVQPGEILKDPALEARARKLSLELRCLVCQNQSIDDSDAPLAKDLRVLVRERLQAGDSDEQVIEFLVARYGEFVLLRPRLSWNTLALWGAPFMLLLIAVFIVWRVFSNRQKMVNAPPSALSPEEDEKLKKLLEQQ